MTIRGGSLRSISYPRVTPGLPSELLTQRPDIREAEANLAAANANAQAITVVPLPPFAAQHTIMCTPPTNSRNESGEAKAEPIDGVPTQQRAP